MSKSYRCNVKVDLQARVRARDAVEYEIDFGRLLGKQEESEILRAKLRAAGGSERDGTIRLDIDGAAVTVDPATGVAAVEVKRDREVVVRVDEERQVWNAGERVEEAQREAQARAEREAGERIEAEKLVAQAELDGRVRDQLAQATPAIVRRLRQVRAELEAEAILRKAERLGTVVGKHESLDPATGDRTLTVEIELPD
jgi:hypothetical protein